MADAGDLEKLPPEIRKQIYAHLLVADTKVGIVRHRDKKFPKGELVTRLQHPYKKKHHGREYDRRKQELVDVPRYTISLLRVNKLIRTEAAPLLYGSNDFEFEHTGALRCFLERIGDSQQYLRNITIVGGGILYNGSWTAFRRSLELLAKAKGLRSLEVSHLAFCGGGWTARAVKIRSFVDECKPLLQSLKATFDKQGLNFNILDVVKVTLPPCAYASLRLRGTQFHHQFLHKHVTSNGGRRGIPVAFDNKQTKFSYTRIPYCDCACNVAEAKHKQFLEELSSEISKMLELDGEQNTGTT